jgi:hypothetical protein
MGLQLPLEKDCPGREPKSLPGGSSLVGGGNLQRFSSRLGRLSHVYLKDQLCRRAC